MWVLPHVNIKTMNQCLNTYLMVPAVCCVTYSLSSVSLLAEGSDRSGGTRGTRSSRGTNRTGVASLSLQEDTR